ncbi:hypothetical protein HDU96_002580 [Phlyctochytrium bullatum]|nr:hypothetical protein HDU96_002580 [Phlyctochytrium bullatum]
MTPTVSSARSGNLYPEKARPPSVASSSYQPDHRDDRISRPGSVTSVSLGISSYSNTQSSAPAPAPVPGSFVAPPRSNRTVVPKPPPDVMDAAAMYGQQNAMASQQRAPSIAANSSTAAPQRSVNNSPPNASPGGSPAMSPNASRQPRSPFMTASVAAPSHVPQPQSSGYFGAPQGGNQPSHYNSPSAQPTYQPPNTSYGSQPQYSGQPYYTSQNQPQQYVGYNQSSPAYPQSNPAAHNYTPAAANRSPLVQLSTTTYNTQQQTYGQYPQTTQYQQTPSYGNYQQPAYASQPNPQYSQPQYQAQGYGGYQQPGAAQPPPNSGYTTAELQAMYQRQGRPGPPPPGRY